MTPLYAAAMAAEMAAAVTAIGLARRQPSHRPAAIALCLLTVVAVSRSATVAILNDLPLPVEGAARMIVYLDGALILAASAVIAGLAITVSSTPEERTRAAVRVVVAWLLASVALGAAYPSTLVRGESLHRIYLVVDLASLFVAVIALAKLVTFRISPTPAQSIAIGLVALDLGILLAPYSPWRASIYLSPQDPVQIGILVFFSAFAAAQGVLWSRYPSQATT